MNQQDTSIAALLYTDNSKEIASFVKKVGTNPTVRDTTARFGVPAPYAFVAHQRRILLSLPSRARSRSDLTEREVSIGGVSWTKFEHCTSKIRRILINFARAWRVVALNQIARLEFMVTQTIRASRSFQSRTKTKNFLTFPFKTAEGAGGPQKKWKGNGRFCLPPLHYSRKGLQIILHKCNISPFLP